MRLGMVPMFHVFPLPLFQVLKCFKQPLSRDDSIPDSLKATINRVCRKFFSSDASSSHRSHLHFALKFKQPFERDFVPVARGGPGGPGSNFPKTLTELTHRLKQWKAFLQHKVGARSRTTLHMEKLAPSLARFHSMHIEVPGQYTKDSEPAMDRHSILQSFQPEVVVQHSHGFSHRRIAMRGSDGKTSYFLVQYSIAHITRSDERMLQLYNLLNRLSDKYAETRRRELRFHPTLVIPLTHRLRLMETNTSHVSLEEVRPIAPHPFRHSYSPNNNTHTLSTHTKHTKH